MGDFADDAIEQSLDMWLNGIDEEWDNWDDPCEYSMFYPIQRRRAVRTKTCNACGRSGLHWFIIGGRWKLHDLKGALHICPTPTIVHSQAKGG